jgi:hypothetical protein
MKDAKKEALEKCRPSNDVPPLQGLEHCLHRLFEDKDHKCLDEICHNLTYEELIGTLLECHDILTTGSVKKSRGRKHFHGSIGRWLDENNKPVGEPWRSNLRRR